MLSQLALLLIDHLIHNERLSTSELVKIKNNMDVGILTWQREVIAFDPGGGTVNLSAETKHCALKASVEGDGFHEDMIEQWAILEAIAKHSI